MWEIFWGGWGKTQVHMSSQSSFFLCVSRTFLMVVCVCVGMRLGSRNMSLKWQKQCSMEACGKFYGFQLVVRFIISFSSICLYFFLRGGCGMRGSDGAVIWAWTEAAQRQTVNHRPFFPAPPVNTHYTTSHDTTQHHTPSLPRNLTSLQSHPTTQVNL